MKDTERFGRALLVAHKEVLLVLLCGVLGVWLVAPGWEWAVPAILLGEAALICAALARRAAVVAVAVVGLATTGVAVHTSWQISRVENEWPEVREALLSEGQSVLGEMLTSAVGLARDLADSAAGAVDVSTDEAFEVLENAVGQGGPERGAVIFDNGGFAKAWAGRHRLAPNLGPEGLSAYITQFYVFLEARNRVGYQVGTGRVLLWADSAVPNRRNTLSERFARATGAAVRFFEPRNAPDTEDVFDYVLLADTLFSVQMVPPAQGDYKLQIDATGGRWVTIGALATLLLLILAASTLFRWIGACCIAALMVFTPAGTRIALGDAFSEATYYLDALGPFSASAGALLVSASLCALALAPLSWRGLPRSRPGIGIALLFVLSAPFAMAFLANGITPPSSGIGVGMWLLWETTLTVASTVVLLLTSLLVRGRGEYFSPAWMSWTAGLWGTGVAVAGLYMWNPAEGWPFWYAFLWVPAIVLAILPAPRLRTAATVAVVAGAAAALLTWGTVADGRLLLAERDASRVGEGDAVPLGYLDRFGSDLLAQPVPTSAAQLYWLWHRSFLSQQDYPAVLASWGPEGNVLASLNLADVGLDSTLLHAIVADHPDEIHVNEVNQPHGKLYLATVPYPNGSVLTVGVGPRSRLIEPARLARFLRGDRTATAPYEMSIGGRPNASDNPYRVTWRRDGWTVRGARVLEHQPDVRQVLRIQVPLGDLERPLIRGALVLVWNALLVGLLWLLGEALMGTVSLTVAIRRLLALRSYRTKLTLVLAGFFVLPALGYSAWTVQRLRGEAERGRDLLIRQTLGDASAIARQFGRSAPSELQQRLTDLTRQINADLIWYDGGELREASPAVLAELGLVDAYIPSGVYRDFSVQDEEELTADVPVGGLATRVGYRNMRGVGFGATLAVPRLVDVRDLTTGQEDLVYGLLLTTLLGVAVAALLAAIAARSLAYPVRSLRNAALSVGRGEDLQPFDPGVPTEFVPVVDAFERMARDVDRSQTALETARRRTAAVLKNVATGVVALDRELKVTIANPRAEELLGAPLPAGAPVGDLGGADWAHVWQWVWQFLFGQTEADVREFTVGSVQIRAQVAPMHGEPSGCVVALDDTTELARAVRVLAWGELARQIAHEIKNPLTPIRLGIQHLERAHKDPRGDYAATLDRTARQILAEIERLDSIARAFARFGAPLAEAAPLAVADLTAIARETAELYSLGGETAVRVTGASPVEAQVRKDEVKEVLINLIENARDAGATKVEVEVFRDSDEAAAVTIADNGGGISSADLPHVFDPQFSTTTSGTGLGLAISKRLVESWGGTIGVESEVGEGTTVRITIQGQPKPEV